MNPKKMARKLLPKKAVHLAEETYRRVRAKALQLRYGFPARGMRVIGVTGTNGKTTTCCMINAILKHAGYKTALFTTAVVEVNGRAELNRTHRTVPLTADLLKLFKKANRANVDFVILEVTSQALHQHKLSGIPIEVAVLTNLTQDHLDYHGTMENYAKAKAMLFNQHFHPKFAILNHDDEWFKFFRVQSVGQVISYGSKSGSDLHLVNKQLKPAGSDFVFKFKSARQSVSIRLPGEFNIYNSLAALGAALALGVEPKTAATGIGKLDAVPGRMENIDVGQPFGVVVDYAYTPDALEKALITLKQIAKGKVMIVFGATGDRDKTKRPVMGQVVAKNADRIFLTDDETYSEDPEAIRQAVYVGIKQVGGEAKTTIVNERKAAIKQAFNEARAGDIVLLAGLGHQDYRAMGGKKEPWDERQVAQQLLKEK